MSGLKYWLWLSTLHGISTKTAKALVEYFGSPKEIYFAREKHYNSAGITARGELSALGNKSLELASRIWRDCDELDIRILTLQDAEYPVRLLNIYDPPTVLYIKGRLPVVDEEVVIGMVGTRGATPYGLRVTERLAYDISKSGAIIVSGLADGIDAAAIRGSLRAGGKPIAVLGTGIDVYYPQKNRYLQDDVGTAGTLISEYPPGTPPNSSNFPVRNRIISGISVGVVVVEAPKQSGALITASRAMEQGRDIFVVPGNIDSFACAGSNELLKDNCALAVTSARDVIREYEAAYPYKLSVKTEAGFGLSEDENEPKAQPNTAHSKQVSGNSTEKVVDNDAKLEYIDLKAQLEGLSEDELALVSVMTEREMHIDDIIDRSGKAPHIVLSALTELELKGYALEQKGKRYSLILSKNTNTRGAV